MKQHFELEGKQKIKRTVIEDFGYGDEIVIKDIKIDGKEMDLVISGRQDVESLEQKDEGFDLELINKEGLQTRKLKMYCYSGTINLEEFYDDGMTSITDSTSHTKYYKGELETQFRHPGDEQMEIPVPHFYPYELKEEE